MFRNKDRCESPSSEFEENERLPEARNETINPSGSGGQCEEIATLKSRNNFTSPQSSKNTLEDWWKSLYDRDNQKKLSKLSNGGKILLLLEIVAHAYSIGKVLHYYEQLSIIFLDHF